jgi:hypothetical protein
MALRRRARVGVAHERRKEEAVSKRRKITQEKVDRINRQRELTDQPPSWERDRFRVVRDDRKRAIEVRDDRWLELPR